MFQQAGGGGNPRGTRANDQHVAGRCSLQLFCFGRQEQSGTKL